jgi:hypothetical protein
MLRFPDLPDALPLNLIRGFETTSKHVLSKLNLFEFGNLSKQSHIVRSLWPLSVQQFIIYVFGFSNIYEMIPTPL